MNLREWFNNNSTLTTIAAVVLLIGALVYMVSSGGRSVKTPTKKWFYDTKTGDLFGEAFTKIAPFESSSGGEAVEAYVYGCGSCDKEDLQILYLMKYSDEGKAQRIAMREYAEQLKDESEHGVLPTPPLGMMTLQDRLVSRERPIHWVPQSSPEGMQIIDTEYDCPDDLDIDDSCFPN